MEFSAGWSRDTITRIRRVAIGNRVPACDEKLSDLLYNRRDEIFVGVIGPPALDLGRRQTAVRHGVYALDYPAGSSEPSQYKPIL